MTRRSSTVESNSVSGQPSDAGAPPSACLAAARWAGVAPATAGAAVAPLQRAPVGAAGPG
eukprot:CAMPEP_0175731740 /NCGR_PEP_ID=MMETSP0097-20121207/50999_1 /TAXON_ID=311494 /ORGANISM="Alexandrium monilatum, Strain CCMP3105" /LENGTH=59 /DNA_ID=CAMNT_0017039691 /DNA_START=141 /DNA_END=317 /DNA_ORIENTATION=-